MYINILKKRNFTGTQKYGISDNTWKILNKLVLPFYILWFPLHKLNRLKQLKYKKSFQI